MIHKDDVYPTYGDMLCDYCDERIDVDTYYCPECKEFSGGDRRICLDCEGEGEREVQADAREFDLIQKFKIIKCETCNGEGEIEL